MKDLLEVGKKRIVIKIGSLTLIAKNKIKNSWLIEFARNVKILVDHGHQVIIVTSGAVALGKNSIKYTKEITSDQKKVAAAVGQIHLMSQYHRIFSNFGIKVAQILLTLNDYNHKQKYISTKNTLETLLANNIIPIINENDAIAVKDIKIGDNDRVAARISQMIYANYLVILSDIDGLYDKNPKLHKDAKLIKEIFEINSKIEKMAKGPTSDVGTGGMLTKIKAAKIASVVGCDTIITDIRKTSEIKEFFLGHLNYSMFYSNKNKIVNNKKAWIYGSINSNGFVTINERAIKALKSKKSLLPVGVVKIDGNFEKGDIILIRSEDKEHIATGITNYSSTDLKKIIGINSEKFKLILQIENPKTELVHIDNLVLTSN